MQSWYRKWCGQQAKLCHHSSKVFLKLRHDIDYKYPFLYEEAEIDSPYKNVPKFIEFVWGKLT